MFAVAGIRLRLREAGYEVPARPEGENCLVRWLCYVALLRESNPPAKAATNYTHSFFIDGKGRLSSCGYAEDEALLGHGEGVTRLNTPTLLPSTLGGETAVMSVAAGAYHSLALAANGAAWSWGYGGELGHGDEQPQSLPKMVEAFVGQRVVAVSAGERHSLAITTDGNVWSWGDGHFGQLGHGDRQIQLLPKEIEAFAGQRVVAVSAGDNHNLAHTAGGAVWSWGSSVHGKLGHGDRQIQLLPKKVESLAEQRVVAVSAAQNHSLALSADGSVWSWGGGAFGKLGHGDQWNQPKPKKVEALAGQRVIAVSAGCDHCLAITADGAAWDWGRGACGALGHGDEQNQLLPKKIEAFAGQRVVAVTAEGSHSLAITADGAFWSWGDGGYGQLGHGDQQHQLLPKKVEMWASRPPTPSSDGEDNNNGGDSDSSDGYPASMLASDEE